MRRFGEWLMSDKVEAAMIVIVFGSIGLTVIVMLLLDLWRIGLELIG